ncbi:MAG: hypothetical protein AAF558_02435 [Verrucomicrobiota bacterium]
MAGVDFLKIHQEFPSSESPEACQNEAISCVNDPKMVNTMDRRTCLALRSLASLDIRFASPPSQRGLLVASSCDSIDYQDFIEIFRRSEEIPTNRFSEATRRFPPLWLLQRLPNMTAAHIAREYKIQGCVHTFQNWHAPVDQAFEMLHLLHKNREIDEILVVCVEILPEFPVSLAPDCNQVVAMKFDLTEAELPIPPYSVADMSSCIHWLTSISQSSKAS